MIYLHALLEQRLFFLFSSENFVHFCHFEQTRKLFSDPPISKYGAKSLQKTSKIFFFWLIFSCKKVILDIQLCYDNEEMENEQK